MSYMLSQHAISRLRRIKQMSRRFALCATVFGIGAIIVAILAYKGSLSLDWYALPIVLAILAVLLAGDASGLSIAYNYFEEFPPLIKNLENHPEVNKEE